MLKKAEQISTRLLLSRRAALQKLQAALLASETVEHDEIEAILAAAPRQEVGQ
jgi:ATP-dependent Zn protease